MSSSRLATSSGGGSDEPQAGAKQAGSWHEWLDQGRGRKGKAVGQTGKGDTRRLDDGDAEEKRGGEEARKQGFHMLIRE